MPHKPTGPAHEIGALPVTLTGRHGVAAEAGGQARRLAVSVLDGLGLALDDGALVLNNRKARGILAYLALESSAPIARERLAGLLWSDVPERHARNSLRQALFELREALQQRGVPGLLAGRDMLMLVRRQHR